MVISLASGALLHLARSLRLKKLKDSPDGKGERAMLSTVLIVILVLALVGALPAWPYSNGWGYYPSGGLGIVFLVVLVLLLTGRV